MRSSFTCFDCGCDSAPNYMVRDPVWLEAWPDYPRLRAEREHTLDWLLLCFDCLERRLGRRLTIDDFDLAIPVNQGIGLGYRMALRLADRRTIDGSWSEET